MSQAMTLIAAGAHSAIEKAAQGLIDDIDCLMSESEGVAGLHLNGDIAPWDALEPGGRFERLTHLDLLRDALAAGAKPEVWQPIETAPKDGTAVFVALKDSDIPQPARWFDQLCGWQTTWDGYNLSGLNYPTHWMPIPAPPKPEKGQ